MCKGLLLMIEKDKALKHGDAVMNRVCRRFVSTSNTTLLKNESSPEIPRGLVEDSSVTVIGIPDSRQDSFQIELIGTHIEGLKSPIVLQYSVLLPGENFTKEPVTLQNTWTQESGWGNEEKCPDHGAPDFLKVYGLVKCNTQMVQRTTDNNLNVSHPANRKLANASEGSTHVRCECLFHFVEGNPFTATLWAGIEGSHMTVNRRHETSFAYRERLEPWLVNRVDVKDGLTNVSLLAKGLPVTEDVDLVADAQQLKATSLLIKGFFCSLGFSRQGIILKGVWL